MKNIENCKLVLNHIEKHPECWNQKQWHCDTSHCFAGWAQILSGKEPEDKIVRKDARLFLGLSSQEADYYFAPSRTLGELKTVLEDFWDRNGYNRDGYDIDGLDINNNPKP